ncbi:MAG: hypothetical protein ACFB6R_02370 [Alphaproteobacteria bacterium]
MRFNRRSFLITIAAAALAAAVGFAIVDALHDTTSDAPIMLGLVAVISAALAVVGGRGRGE